MEIHKDFKELLELFGAHKVEYFIANKRALGRKRDLADLEALGQDLKNHINNSYAQEIRNTMK
jgi:hypothetical protein